MSNQFDFKNYIKKLINEKYEGDVDPATLNLGTKEELRSINDDIETKKAGGYTEFVNFLKAKAKDPKVHALLYSGLFDGDEDDDKVIIEKTDIPVTSLIPTQKEIGLADSLGWVSKNNPQGGAKLAAANPGFVADVGGRIIAADGRFIIDGHHRWSQVYLLNPQAKIPAYNLIAPDSPIPGKSATSEGQDFLKMAQIAIAAVDQNVPVANANTATDIYRTGGDRDKITNVIKTVIPEGSPFATELASALKGVDKIPQDSGTSAAQALSEMKIYNYLFEQDWKEEMMANIKAAGSLTGAGTQQDQKITSQVYKPDYENVINYVVENAIALYNGTHKDAAGMTARSEMPQFDKSGSPEDKINALASGKVDWNAPYDTGDIVPSAQESESMIDATLSKFGINESKIKRIIRAKIRQKLNR